MIINFETAETGVEGYCLVENPSYPYQNSVSCGANNNIYWRFVINFFVSK